MAFSFPIGIRSNVKRRKKCLEHSDPLHKGTRMCEACWLHSALERKLKRQANKVTKDYNLRNLVKAALSHAKNYDELFYAAKLVWTIDRGPQPFTKNDIRNEVWDHYSKCLRKFWPDTTNT